MDTTRPSLLIRIRDPADAAAWRAFDEIYRPMLFRFGKANGLSDADAEDVTQHCLAAVSTRIASFEYDPSRGRFKGWLRTVVNNRVRNLWRGRHDQAAASGQLEAQPARQESPEEAFERLWMEEHLWHCLRCLEQELDAATYQAYVRYVIRQEPPEEICASLGLSRGNLHTIKWRVTRRVSEKMAELLGDE